MRTSYNQCHSNLIVVSYHQPLDPIMDIYDRHTFDLKPRVDVCTRMDFVPVEKVYLGILLILPECGIMCHCGLLVYLYGLALGTN